MYTSGINEKNYQTYFELNDIRIMRSNIKVLHQSLIQSLHMMALKYF
jgi:hypothetical protein